MQISRTVRRAVSPVRLGASMVALALVSSVCLAFASAQTNEPQADAPFSHQVIFTTGASRENAQLLDGATVPRNVNISYVGVRPTNSYDPVFRVEFYLDDPAYSAAFRIDHEAPYEMVRSNSDGSAAALDTATLTPGEHQLTVSVFRERGNRYSRVNMKLTFIVGDYGQTPTTTTTSTTSTTTTSSTTSTTVATIPTTIVTRQPAPPAPVAALPGDTAPTRGAAPEAPGSYVVPKTRDAVDTSPADTFQTNGEFVQSVR